MTSDPLNPTVEEFDDFKDIPDESVFLEWARDLFILDTGIEDVTEYSDREKEMIRRAILHMAWYLQEDHASREDYFSQFNTERIGSYYYSKAGHGARTSSGSEVTIPAYDMAVMYFLRHSGNDDYSQIWSTTTSEWVFSDGYHESRTVYPRGVYS